MKNVKLSELLTQKQLEKVTVILRDPPSNTRSIALKKYLITQREALELKGVLPEYLSYMIEYLEMKAMNEFTAEEKQHVQNN